MPVAKEFLVDFYKCESVFASGTDCMNICLRNGKTVLDVIRNVQELLSDYNDLVGPVHNQPYARLGCDKYLNLHTTEVVDCLPDAPDTSWIVVFNVVRCVGQLNITEAFSDVYHKEDLERRTDLLCTLADNTQLNPIPILELKSIISRLNCKYVVTAPALPAFAWDTLQKNTNQLSPSIKQAFMNSVDSLRFCQLTNPTLTKHEQLTKLIGCDCYVL